MVTKEELLAKIWHVEYASDAVLTRAVAQARRLLGHEGGGAAYIQTVHGRGYRFVAPTEEVPFATAHPLPPSPPIPASRKEHTPAPGKGNSLRRYLPLAAALLAALTLLAVLAKLAGDQPAPLLDLEPPPLFLSIPPFLISGHDTELSIAGSTLRQLLFHRLREEKGLLVFAEDLGEDGVVQTPPGNSGASLATLTGTVSVRRSGWGVLELFLAWRPAGKHLLVSPIGVYDFPLLARGQGIVSFLERRDAIVTAARHDVLWVLGKTPDSPSATLHPDTLHLYLLAVDSLNGGWEQGETARSLLEQVLAREPAFAYGWITYAWALYSLTAFSGHGGEYYALARSAAERARLLAPQNHHSYVVSALVLVETGEAEAAYEQLLAGLQQRPDETALHYFSSYVLRYAGLLEAARESLERSLALDPLVLSRHGGAPTVYLYLGEHESFAAALSGLASPLNLFYEGFAAFLDPRRSASPDSLRRAFETAPNSHFGRLAAALLALDEGRRQDALTLLRQLDLQRRQLKAGDGEFSYKIAQLAALAGDADLAMASLATGVKLGFFCSPCLVDATLAPVHARPEFRALLAQSSRRQAAFAERFGLPLTPADRAHPLAAAGTPHP